MIVMAEEVREDRVAHEDGPLGGGLQQRVELVLDAITAKVEEIRAILTEEQKDAN